MSFLTALATYTLLPYAILLLSLYAVESFAPPLVSRYAGFGARCVAFIGSIIVCASYGSIASIVLNLFGQGGLSQWTTARSFKWVYGLQTGVWFEVEDNGKEWLATRPAVFVGNHQTELDVAMIGAVFPKYISITAKKALKYYPVLGQFMSLSNSVFIDRTNHASAIATFSSASDHMRRARQSVFIFPEGTRSYSEVGNMLPFKKGAFHLAIQAQVPIVPVVTAAYGNILSFKRKEFKRGVVKVRVLEPISTEGKTGSDVEELVRTVRERMEVTLKELEAERLGSGKVANGGLKKKVPVSG